MNSQRRRISDGKSCSTAVVDREKHEKTTKSHGYTLPFGRASKTVKRQANETFSEEKSDSDSSDQETGVLPPPERKTMKRNSSSSSISSQQWQQKQFYRTLGGAVGQRLKPQLGLLCSGDVRLDDDWFGPDRSQKRNSQSRNDLPHPSMLCDRRRAREKRTPKRRGGVDLPQLIAQIKRKQADWHIDTVKEKTSKEKDIANPPEWGQHLNVGRCRPEVKGPSQTPHLPYQDHITQYLLQNVENYRNNRSTSEEPHESSYRLQENDNAFDINEKTYSNLDYDRKFNDDMFSFSSRGFATADDLVEENMWYAGPVKPWYEEGTDLSVLPRCSPRVTEDAEIHSVSFLDTELDSSSNSPSFFKQPRAMSSAVVAPAFRRHVNTAQMNDLRGPAEASVAPSVLFDQASFWQEDLEEAVEPGITDDSQTKENPVAEEKSKEE